MKRILSLYLVIIVFSNAIFAVEDQVEAKLEKVKLQLKYFHSFQFAGYYAALQQGFYAEEGLDVEIIERSLDKPVVGQVMTGQANYGIENSGILLKYANGLQIQALAAIFQHNPLVFISKQSSGIIGPHEMRGKRIMMYDGNDGADEIPLRALLHEARLSQADYIHIPQSFNNDDLINDKTDVIVGYITDQPFYYNEQGLAVNIINPLTYGFDFYSDLLFASEKELIKHPERARRFRKASIKGWGYALTHTEELIQIIHKDYKSQSSINRLRYEADQTRKLIIPNRIPIGDIKAKRLRQIADIYLDMGLAKELTDEQLNSFIFDHRKILQLSQQEKNWLAQNPVIRVGIDINGAPHEWIDESGNYLGHAADYLKLLEGRIGVKFQIIKDKSWVETVEMAKQGKVDMLSSIVSTPERQQFLNFTTSYTDNPAIIVNDNSEAYIGYLSNLNQKKVALEKGYFLHEMLKKEYPLIEICIVDNTLEALELVAKGEADAYVGDAVNVNYMVNKSGLLNLRYSGQTDYVIRHSVAVVKNQDILFSIINKATKSITKKERDSIEKHWLNLQIKQGISVETLLEYVAIIVTLFSIFVFWVFRLRKEVEKRRLIEISLRQTEQRFVKSQYAAGFGVWEWDIETNKTYWSEAVAPLFGYKAGKQNIDNVDFLNAIHPDDRTFVANAMETCIKRDQSYNVDFRIIWDDGSVHWLHETGDIFEDETGKPISMLGTVNDITEQKLVNDVLQTLTESKSSEKENIFRIIVRQLAISQDVKYAFVGTNNTQEKGVIDTVAVWGNNEYVDNFTYYLEGTPCNVASNVGYCLITDHVQEQFPDDRLLVEMQVRSYLGVPLLDSEKKLIGILALLDDKPMRQQNSTGNLLKSLAVRASIEIERKIATESLQIAALVYQSSKEAMIMTDSHDLIVATNPAFTEITGYSEHEVLGKNPNLFKSGRHSSAFFQAIWKQINKTGKWQGEIDNKLKNSEICTHSMSINTIYDDNSSVYRRIALFTDISEQKAAEKLLKEHSQTLEQEVNRQTHALVLAKDKAVRADQAKSEFLANMSHELRTPMHGILSFSSFGMKQVEQGDLEKLAKYFDRINTSGERLMVLLDDLLDLSKLEAGKMEVNKEFQSLLVIVQTCLAEQDAWIQNKQLHVCWRDKGEKLLACLDYVRITQVVYNLLSNAIKFSPASSHLYFSINSTELNGSPALKFTLEDEGVGIPKQELEQVFDKFIQSSKTKTKAGGTGLGLAICAEIIELHYGRIWAELSAGGGAVFQFVIPVESV